ncbi:toll/interleukin-1 receptor domain-containing protein [Streptomyces sp. NBC_01381]|uniref:toll/interleukin-1 receptor domain-containing protein n=1 Tax=Streptomyces sp. NBC_01381 TaxID=2903845 RepID=UPI002256314E|nr:toll/interleukin-1 receptor domain-containing protein [Streptomyces sp. NBC_01381]MCX4673425.1 toll/interleukin-1 receptor domain-containing protein [Streptomyces sp. NBC_01381]
MGGIFINYRRGGHEHVVHRLYRELTGNFGEDQVFLDRQSIVPGQQYSDVLRERVADCEVLLVVVHPGWADARDEATGARRLDLETDWVRREIDQALQDGKTVIPLFLDGAEPPTAEQLPERIQKLEVKNGQWLRQGAYDSDLAELIAALEDKVSKTWEPIPPPSPPYRPGRWLGVVTAVLSCAVLVTVPALPQDDGWVRTDGLPFTLYATMFSCLLMLAPLIAVTVVRLLFRRPLDIWERDLHAVKHQTYVRQTWPLAAGLLLIAVFGALSMWGDGGTLASFALLLVLGFAIVRTAALNIRLQRRENDLWERWPHCLPAPATRMVLRRAVARLDLRLREMRTPLSREQREKARWELADLSKALRRVTGEAERSRRAWLRQDHPWLFGFYALWLALTAASALASGLAFSRAEHGTTRVHVALAIVTLIGAALALATAELGHRLQRRQRTQLVREARDRIDKLAARVTTLSTHARTKPSAPAPRPEEYPEPD